MIFKRVGLWLSVACLLAVVGLADGASAAPLASAAPSASATDKGSKLTAIATLESAPKGDASARTRCEIVSQAGHRYTQQWCETQVVWIRWYLGSMLLGTEDVLIDVFGPVMRDQGGWSQLQGGVAITSRPGGQVGVFIENSTAPIRISVIGTDNAKWCNTESGPGAWSGWGHC